MSSFIVSMLHYIWLGLGVFISLIIVGALAVFMYDHIKSFTNYIIGKIQNRFKKGDNKHENQ